MTNVQILDSWSTTTDGDPYTAPECRKLRLQGVVRNGQFAGRGCLTSPVDKVNGRYITTRSGSVYLLGKIDPGFYAWLKKNRPDWDWRNPIKIIEVKE